MNAIEHRSLEGARRLPMEIETNRLILRRPVLADAEPFANQLNNINVAGNLARVALPYTLEQAKEYLHLKALPADPSNSSFTIATRADGLIGNVGFSRSKNGVTELGYWLGQPYWGHGFMTEATRAAIAWYFDNTQSDTLGSGVFHFNMASLAIQYKLGFVETGRSTRRCAAQGIDVEHIDTELNKEDFEASMS